MNFLSSSAVWPLPFFSVHPATEALVSDFTDACWLESRQTDCIRFLNVIPAGINTHHQHSGGGFKRSLQGLLSPEFVVARLTELFDDPEAEGPCYIGERKHARFCDGKESFASLLSRGCQISAA
jgi:hypothetical protein